MGNQILELLRMQEALDESIFKAKDIEEYPLDEARISLFVEVGELMNEFPTYFKYWKSSAVDNREKGLVEYVDCLHFALSLTNYELTESEKESIPNYSKCKNWWNTYDCIEEISDDLTRGSLRTILEDLFALGNHLGFTWEEIYNAYKEKNKVNWERLKNKY